MSRDAGHIVESVAPASAVRGRRIALGIFGFAALTAVAARFGVPLPGTAVPMTLQPVAVLLAGAVLGSRAGAASQAAYLAAGALGLPVFAAGGGAAYLLGPTGGYLLAFPVAAAVAGLWKPGSGRWVAGALYLAGALAVIHLGGIAWLTVVSGGTVAVGSALRPFLVGDALKVLLVLAILRLGPGALRGRSS